jgi:hypothetical protein
VFGIAVAGLVLGHLATYALLYPDPDHRVLVLTSTGHAYLPALADLACVLAAAAVAAVIGRAWGNAREGGRLVRRTGRRPGDHAGIRVRRPGGPRAPGQRLAAHDLFSGPLLVLGVGAQVTLAMIGAAIATWLRRTTQHVAARAPFSTPARAWRPRALVLLVAADRGPATLAFVGVRPDGPPSI